jgi:hypothetical protein
MIIRRTTRPKGDLAHFCFFPHPGRVSAHLTYSQLGVKQSSQVLAETPDSLSYACGTLLVDSATLPLHLNPSPQPPNMSATNGSAVPKEASEIADKGKSVDTTASHDMMEDDDEESEEESGVEDVS